MGRTHSLRGAFSLRNDHRLAFVDDVGVHRPRRGLPDIAGVVNLAARREARLPRLHGQRRLPVNLKHYGSFDDVTEVVTGMTMPRRRNARGNLNRHFYTLPP